MPASLTFRSSSPSRSRSPVPSLAPSWWSPCQTLRLVLMTTFSCAPWGPSASICTGLGLCLLGAIAFSCRLVALLALCQRMQFPSFLREVIHAAGASRPEVGSVRAHEVRSVSTSVAFHLNWSISSVLESATWASSSVFSSFYLHDIQHEYDGMLSLGPFVAAGSRIG